MDPKVLLKAGDCLLYSPVGVFGWAIFVKTWHPISHVEVYDGNHCSWASRDGQGVNLYPLRLSELAYVLRPTEKLNLDVARTWAKSKIGTPYGWLDLLNFAGIPISTKGMFCSDFEVEFYRHAGWDMLPLDTSKRVAPFENLSLVDVQPGFTLAYRIKKGKVV